MTLIRKSSAILALSLLYVLPACNGASSAIGDQGQDLRPAGPAPVVTPAPPGTPAPSPTTTPAPTAGSCISTDPAHYCIGVKVVSYTDSTGKAALTRDQADTVIQGINNLWSTCNIGFQIEAYDAEDPTKLGLSYGASSENELTQIRQEFSDSSTFLLAVTGSWNTSTIAWTEMPGGAPYGTVVDADFATSPVCVGHEFGHYMGLDHDPNVGNIMYYIVYDTDTTITSAQCDQARQTIQSNWQAMLR